MKEVTFRVLLQKKISHLYPNVKCSISDGVVFLTGELPDWQSVVAAGYLAAGRGRHVVNDITVPGLETPPMRLPPVCDGAIDGARPDVLIIGGGISGASIARELMRLKLSVLLVEKEHDLAMQASGRNDGEVHPGVDLNKGSLKQHYVVRGNAMMEKVCAELNIPLNMCGQYAGLRSRWLTPLLWLFALQRRAIGVRDTRIVGTKALRGKEPELFRDFEVAIYNPHCGSVCPYGLTIAYAENAVMNGARVSLDTAVTGMEVENGRIVSVITNRGVVYPRLVINAAGTFADQVAKMAGDRFYSIHPRRGTNSILDKKAGTKMHTIAGVKLLRQPAGHTKGGGILHTVDDNLLVGPNAVETPFREDFATEGASVKAVFDKQRNTMPSLSERDIITWFTGVRACTYEEDFVIEPGRRTHNLIHCAGIQSPGLTAAPAVAVDVAKMARKLLEKEGPVEDNADFDPHRPGIPVVRELPRAEREALIAKNPDYGVIICRCEQVSRGEIIDALESPIPVATVDGVKKRVRPGMGRCQGGFCSPLVLDIIAEHEGVARADVKKSGDRAFIAFGNTKGAAE